MTTRALLFALVPLALLVPAGGCANDDAVVGSERTAAIDPAALHGTRLELALEPGAVDPAILEASGHDLRTRSGARAAQIRVEARTDDATIVAYDLWTPDPLGADALITAMRRDHAPLADAVITHRALPPDAAPDPHATAPAPEDAEAEIVERLRAQGIEGDIDVTVDDTPEGRRVEVRVEREGPDAPPPGAPLLNDR